MMVDFMVIGAQKCGTTTLYDILERHPSIVGCKPKEPHFFSTCDDWRVELPRYEGMFRRQEGALYFEASTTYTFYPLRNLEIWEDIYEYNPGMKFIYLVRDPVDRITSNYMHMYERGYTDLRFEQSLVKNRSYIDISRYATQIKPFIRRFGSDRVRIILFDDLISRPQEVVEELAPFLGVPVDGFGDVAAVHSNRSIGGGKRHHRYDRASWLLNGIRRLSPWLWRRLSNESGRRFAAKPLLSPPFRRMILHMLESEIDELEILIGSDLSHWKRFPEPAEAGQPLTDPLLVGVGPLSQPS